MGARCPADPGRAGHAPQAHDRDGLPCVPRHPADHRHRGREGRGRAADRAHARDGRRPRPVGQRRLGEPHAGLRPRGPGHEPGAPHRPHRLHRRAGRGGRRHGQGVHLGHRLPDRQRSEDGGGQAVPPLRPQRDGRVLPACLRADREHGHRAPRHRPVNRRLPVRGGQGGRARGRARQARRHAALEQLERHRPQEPFQASRPGARQEGVRGPHGRTRAQARVRAGRGPQGQVVGFYAYTVVA